MQYTKSPPPIETANVILILLYQKGNNAQNKVYKKGGFIECMYTR